MKITILHMSNGLFWDYGYGQFGSGAYLWHMDKLVLFISDDDLKDGFKNNLTK